MHEFKLCESIISQVEKANNGSLYNIKEIILSVGELAVVDIDSLKFWFGVIVKKVGAGNIELIINRINPIARCGNCGSEFSIHSVQDACSNCKKFGNLIIIQGKELLIKSFIKDA